MSTAASLAVKLLDTGASHLQEVSLHSITKIKKMSHLQKISHYIATVCATILQANNQISTSPYSCEPSCEPSIITAL